MPSAGLFRPEADLSALSPPEAALTFASSWPWDMLTVGGEAAGSIATYGKVVGSTLRLPSPTDTWILPIDALVPGEIVDPPTMIPPADAFAMPCPFRETKGLVAVADGIWIAFPPIIIPAEFCVMRIPSVVVSLLPTDRWFPSMAMPPLGCAAIVCPAAAICAAAG